MKCLLVLLSLAACDAQRFFLPAVSEPGAEEIHGAVLGDTSLVLYGNSPIRGEIYAASIDGSRPTYDRNRPRPEPYRQPAYRPVPLPAYNPVYSPVAQPPRVYPPTPLPYGPLPVGPVPSQVYRPPVLRPNPPPVYSPSNLVNPRPVLSSFPLQPVFNQSLPIPINRVVPNGANAASLASSFSDGARTGAQSLSYTG